MLEPGYDCILTEVQATKWQVADGFCMVQTRHHQGITLRVGRCRHAVLSDCRPKVSCTATELEAMAAGVGSWNSIYVAAYLHTLSPSLAASRFCKALELRLYELV